MKLFFTLAAALLLCQLSFGQDQQSVKQKKVYNKSTTATSSETTKFAGKKPQAAQQKSEVRAVTVNHSKTVKSQKANSTATKKEDSATPQKTKSQSTSH